MDVPIINSEESEMKIRYEYNVVSDGERIYAKTREEAREIKREEKEWGAEGVKIVQRKWILQEDKVIR